MELKNPLYKNQGIHVISSIFTVEKGVVKVLLVKRKNEPYCGKWALPGGALYNNEELVEGATRELYEKTGLKDVELIRCNVFGAVNRSPLKRMIAISYLGVIDSLKVTILKETMKTTDCDWVKLLDVPELAYDHNVILMDAVEQLKEKIITSSILKTLFPTGFTIPEIQKCYESILGETYDRRNFRRKLLNLDLIEATNKTVQFEGKKPANLYEFKIKNSKSALR